MHEMGVASSVLEAVHKELARHEGEGAPHVRKPLRATRVALRIGEFAGVDPESLRFCFDAIKQGTEFEALELDIEWREQTDQLDFVALELEEEAVA